MTLRIVAGRQEPAPGSKRYRRMATVLNWLQANRNGGSYTHIAMKTGLSVTAVADAAADLKRFGPSDLFFRTPAPKNGYTAGIGWNTFAKAGMANQARHLATRLESQVEDARRAVKHETDPAKAAMLRMVTRSSAAEAANQRDFATVIEP
jgi:hypothetical protein